MENERKSGGGRGWKLATWLELLCPAGAGAATRAPARDIHANTIRHDAHMHLCTQT